MTAPVIQFRTSATRNILVLDLQYYYNNRATVQLGNYCTWYINSGFKNRYGVALCR